MAAAASHNLLRLAVSNRPIVHRVNARRKPLSKNCGGYLSSAATEARCRAAAVFCPLLLPPGIGASNAAISERLQGSTTVVHRYRQLNVRGAGGDPLFLVPEARTISLCGDEAGRA